jgi:hypothetical protein
MLRPGAPRWMSARPDATEHIAIEIEPIRSFTPDNLPVLRRI